MKKYMMLLIAAITIGLFHYLPGKKPIKKILFSILPCTRIHCFYLLLLNIIVCGVYAVKSRPVDTILVACFPLPTMLCFLSFFLNIIASNNINSGAVIAQGKPRSNNL